MSIASEITRLQNAKEAIKQSLENKGATVSSSATLDTYPNIIDNLPSGGDDSVLRDLIERDITSITIPEGTTTIKGYVFYGCAELLSVTIPDSVENINGYAFGACSALSSITIPNSVTYIGNAAFYFCSSLTSVTIGNSVTYIDDRVFQYCSSLTTITIPASVTYIANNAFDYCISLQSITVQATTPPELGSNAFASTNNCPIYVPAESVEAYKTATNWSAYADRIQAI